MRALTEGELLLIRAHNLNHAVKTGEMLFTAEDVEALAKEDVASFKVFRAAEKIIEEHTKRMNAALPRAEAIQVFYPRDEFEKFYANWIMPILREHICLRRVLIAKGLITDAEVDEEVKKFIEEAKARENAQQAEVGATPANEQVSVEAS